MPTGAQAVSTQQIAALRPLTLDRLPYGTPAGWCVCPATSTVSRNEGESTPQTDRTGPQPGLIRTRNVQAGFGHLRALRDWLSTATVAVTEDDESQSWLDDNRDSAPPCTSRLRHDGGSCRRTAHAELRPRTFSWHG